MAEGVAAAAIAAPTWNARIGLAVALAVLLAVLAALWLGLPDPWWAAISAWRIVDPQPAAALARSLDRIAGTVLGAALAFIAAGLAGDAQAVQLILIFAVVAFGTWKRFTTARNYAWILGTVTAAMVLVQSLSGPDGLYAFAVARVLEILCGVVVATMVELVVVPIPPAPQRPAAAAAAPGPETLRVALLAGTATVLVVLLWSAFDLPSVVQLVISVIMVVDRDVIQLRARGFQRTLGCLAGAGLGLALIAFGLAAFPVWAAALGGSVFLFSALGLGGGPWAYVGLQGGMAVITALVVGPGPPDPLTPVLERLAGILLGVLLLVIVSHVLAPRPGARG